MACTEDFLQSEFSHCNMADVETDSDEADDASPTPVLDVRAGLQPESARMRVPPTTWLVSMGFVAAGQSAFASSPFELANSDEPKYLNLFSRQMLARAKEGLLSEATLAQHDIALGRRRHCGPSGPSNADRAEDADREEQNSRWLEAFVPRARATPLNNVTSSMFSKGLSTQVASFLDDLSDESTAGAEIDGEDVPDGCVVTGHKVFYRRPHYGPGRLSFFVDADALISTPGRSPSPPVAR